MRVREEHRVDVRDVVPEHLLPQIGCRVDEDPRVLRNVDVYRRPQPLDRAESVGPARRAAAADHRDAVRRPGAEHRDASLDPALDHAQGQDRGQGVMMRDCGLLASTNRRRSS